MKNESTRQAAASRLGEERVNKQGIGMRIIAYRSATDIDVLFLNGHDEVVTTRYQCFLDGRAKSWKAVIGKRLTGLNGVVGTVIDAIGTKKIIVEYDSGEVLTLDRNFARKGQILPPPYKYCDASELIPIEGYPGKYLDREGNIYNARKRALKLRKSSNGYLNIGLWNKDRKELDVLSVHRLVAQAFIPNPDGKPEVNHIDGNPSNNRVENLEWCTRSENVLHSRHVLGNCIGEKCRNAVLTEDIVREIVRLHEEGLSYGNIAARFNTSKQRVYCVINGKSWNHVTGLPYKSKSKARVA